MRSKAEFGKKEPDFARWRIEDFQILKENGLLRTNPYARLTTIASSRACQAGEFLSRRGHSDHVVDVQAARRTAGRFQGGAFGDNLYLTSARS